MLSVDEIFKGRHFDREIIVLCVRWYLRYKLSFRDLVEMMAERGLSLAHTTIMRWIRRFASELGLIDSWCKSLSYNGIIRARSNSTPARPYMARLRVFSLLICPSVCPLLQGSDIAFRTASRSWRIVFAKRCIA
jgi:hypothetical protein